MRVKITSYKRKKQDVGQDGGDTIDQRLYLKSDVIYSENSVIGCEAMLKLKYESSTRHMYMCTCGHISRLMAPRLDLKLVYLAEYNSNFSIGRLAMVLCRNDYENCVLANPSSRRRSSSVLFILHLIIYDFLLMPPVLQNRLAKHQVQLYNQILLFEYSTVSTDDITNILIHIK